MACNFVIPDQICRLFINIVLWIVALLFLADFGGLLSFFAL